MGDGQILLATNAGNAERCLYQHLQEQLGYNCSCAGKNMARKQLHRYESLILPAPERSRCTHPGSTNLIPESILPHQAHLSD